MYCGLFAVGAGDCGQTEELRGDHQPGRPQHLPGGLLQAGAGIDQGLYAFKCVVVAARCGS